MAVQELADGSRRSWCHSFRLPETNYLFDDETGAPSLSVFTRTFAHRRDLVKLMGAYQSDKSLTFVRALTSIEHIVRKNLLRSS
jgi:hypothetical protein